MLRITNIPYGFRITLPLVCLLLSGCNSIQTRISNAESIASKNGFIKKIIPTKQFKIVSYQKISSYIDTAVIYIEGDGLAWKNKYRISENPTPANPVALKLATIDRSDTVIYLGRPCQYIDIESERSCKAEFWTNRRVSAEVINTFNTAINIIKNNSNINKIRLVGYSGGGSIAAILAAMRKDIIDLRTIAGNLDIEAFSKIHNVSPLTGSINPVNYANKLVNVPQLHIISSNDTVITKQITDSYISHLKNYDENLRCTHLLEINNPSHTKGWEDVWNENHSDIHKCN